MTEARVTAARLAPRLPDDTPAGTFCGGRPHVHPDSTVVRYGARRAPYRLLEVPGIGWARADAMARALGVAPGWLAAPTGRASARMQALSQRPASTVHKLLGGAPGSMRTAGPITDGLVVLDEASMVDVATMAWVARNLRVRPDAGGLRLLLVGNACQLPAVGHGRVLGDVLASGVVASTTPAAPRRQAVDSRIVAQAHRLRAGQPLPTGDTHDWQVVPLPPDAGAAQRVVLQTVRRVVHEERTSLFRTARASGPRFDPVRELQVITPRRGGALGTDALNPRLRDLLNPTRAPRRPMGTRGRSLTRRPRPACGLAGASGCDRGTAWAACSNDYTVGDRGLMNGEQGVVESVEGDTITLRLDDAAGW